MNLVVSPEIYQTFKPGRVERMKRMERRVKKIEREM